MNRVEHKGYSQYLVYPQFGVDGLVGSLGQSGRLTVGNTVGWDKVLSARTIRTPRDFMGLPIANPDPLAIKPPAMSHA